MLNIFNSSSVVVSSGVGGRGELSLAEVQCHLDKEGASDLVIDLIMNATSDRIFQESILLAIALLEGGNTVIQVSQVYWAQEFTVHNSADKDECEVLMRSNTHIAPLQSSRTTKSIPFREAWAESQQRDVISGVQATVWRLWVTALELRSVNNKTWSVASVATLAHFEIWT